MARLVAIATLVVLAVVASGAAESTTSAACPRGALPLNDANPIGPAGATALRRESASAMPQVGGATLATLDSTRRSEVIRQCGRATATRTVVVYVLPGASLPA